jgi:hypothetical protein
MWKVMTDVQKKQHRDGERVRRATRKTAMTEEQKCEFALKRNNYTISQREREHGVVLGRERKYRQEGKGYFYCWANAIKTRAKAKGIPYELDADFLQSIFPTHCPILGNKLERSIGKRPGPFSPTVDRIFPEKGYVRDNVMIISKRANQIKSDATPEEVMKVAQYWALLCAGLQEV